MVDQEKLNTLETRVEKLETSLTRCHEERMQFMRSNLVLYEMACKLQQELEKKQAGA